uniref:Uncharacterized protein MANES_12G040100 n=1 Tax=Rhizophora mucronata TaxID=61149 RepID=A0A2P2NIR2_RHIMU
MVKSIRRKTIINRQRNLCRWVKQQGVRKITLDFLPFIQLRGLMNILPNQLK